ncbi:inverse autotransporter beta domain-containing protein, partial [Serratia ureilytica]|uniref:inverse autotransporter beta domain-containing protein n=1 Tax=Serratia ureilytica TaxID=300181 RepID=UPI00313D15EC
MLQVLAWLNIIIQVLFPLAGAFTPGMAAAGRDGHFLAAPTEPAGIRTRAYLLSAGETVDSVAKKYNMSTDALRQLNQLRTFAHGFDHLTQGDELDVPLTPLPTVSWEDEAPRTSGASTEDVQAQKMAGIASGAGSFLAGRPNGDAVTSLARGMASGAVSEEIQQWLSRAGTARVQLDVGKNLSLKNSQLDLLTPLYEQQDGFVFTQGSLHRTDDRTQTNLGVGYRWFVGDGMVGGNAFLDHDLSLGHSRLGVGGEYWRNFLKLGVNGYHRLTGWRDAMALDDYEARPASGWDIRAQAWLPALPQLGGKLTFEQYYGEGVALFSQDHRQSNPHAITAGVNYTPIPLLTLSAERRQGREGASEARVGIEVNYQLGVPWHQQINPDAVTAMRTLAGSRYDLVDRNNNIVLEYRKKEVISLRMADVVTGFAGERKSLNVSVNSTYGVERIDWSASSLVAAGGKVERDGMDWTVTLPPHQSGEPSMNSYTLSAVAVDKKGNVSNRSDTQVTVQPPVISIDELKIDDDNAPANGSAEVKVTARIKDSLGQGIAHQKVTFTITHADGSEDVREVMTDSEGGIKVNVTSRAPGTANVRVEAGNAYRVGQVHFGADSANPDATQSTLTATPATLVADGKASSVLTLSLQDVHGNPIAGQAVTFAVSGVTGTELGDVTDNQDGTYTARLTGTTAGIATVNALVGGSAFAVAPATVTLTADSATAGLAAADVVVVTDGAIADGKATNSVKATVKDAKGNALPGVTVTFSAGNGASMEKEGTTGADGSVLMTLTSVKAGEAVVSVSVGADTRTVTVHFRADSANPDATQSTLTATPATLVADGK